MKKYLILLFLSVSFLVYGQIEPDTSYSTSLNSIKPLHFSFETGTSFIHSKNFGNYNEVYFAPGLRMNVTPKLNVNVKTILSYPTYASFMFDEGVNHVASNSQNVSLMAQGEYRFNDKLHLNASYYKGDGQPRFYNSLIMSNGLIPSAFQIENAYSIGFMYKLTNNISIGAEYRAVEYSVFPRFPY